MGVTFPQSIVLQEQIAGISAEGGPLPSGDISKELAQAQQMINEMRNRNFGQQLTETEKEKRDAQLCKSFIDLTKILTQEKCAFTWIYWGGADGRNCSPI